MMDVDELAKAVLQSAEVQEMAGRIGLVLQGDVFVTDPTWEPPATPEPEPPDVVKLSEDQVATALRLAFEAGLHETARPDAERRIREEMSSTASPADPTADYCTPAEFVSILKDEAPFLFIGKKGSGHQIEAKDEWE